MMDVVTNARSYNDLCGTARALDIVGERWALLIVRELLLGAKRFSDLRRGLPTVGPDMLSLRLRELESAGVVQKLKLPPPHSAQVYELTDWGYELEPAVTALGRWGSRAPVGASATRLSVDAFVIALKALFSVSIAAEFTVTCELVVEGQPFTVHVENGSLVISRGAADVPDIRITSDTGSLARLLWTAWPLTEAVQSGAVSVKGNRTVIRRYLKLFPLSEPASTPN